MDWNAVKVVLDLIALVLAIGAWIYAWRVGHRQAQKKEIEGLKDLLEQERSRRRHDVEDLTSRLTRAETKIEEAPTGKALHELALSISELAGDLKTAFARLDGLGEIVRRLESITNRQEDFLLNGPKR